MRQIRLGKTDLTVSRVAFGTWQLGGEWGATDESAAIAAIRRAADSGITLFDTAQAYGFGASEQLLAKAVAGRPRHELVIATKGGLRTTADGLVRDSSPAWIREGVDHSLRALDTDYIDIYQLHWPDPVTPIDETATALAKLVADGKIRHVGVSNFDVAQMAAMDHRVAVETIQPPYHLFRRDIEAEILPYTRTHDIGVLVYGPLAHGLLSGRMTPDQQFAPDDWRSKSALFRGEPFRRNLEIVAELNALAQQLGTTVSRLAVAWTLAQPGVHVAIVGTRDPAHVDDAVAAADLVLDTDVLSQIDRIDSRAVPVAGPSPETV